MWAVVLLMAGYADCHSILHVVPPFWIVGPSFDVVGLHVLDFTAQDACSFVPQEDRASPFSVLFGVSFLVALCSMLCLRLRRPSWVNDLPDRPVRIFDDDVTSTSGSPVFAPLGFWLPQSVSAPRHLFHSAHFEQAITSPLSSGSPTSSRTTWTGGIASGFSKIFCLNS